MYKVFIDNVPIYFQKDGSFRTNLPGKFFPSLKIKDFKEFSRYIANSNLKKTQFVNNKDPFKQITSFFSQFTWIEAAGGIVRNTKTNQYLFILRNAVWDIPKGKIEADETPEIAAVREIKEECGLKEAKIIQALPPTFHVYFAYGQHFIKKTHWFALESEAIEVQGQIEEDITEVKWFTEEEISTVRQNTFASIQDVLNSYFRNK